MKITYKDVGQGDSIILEWVDNEVQKVGIIDCNLKGRSNPVLEHIRKAGYAEIEFIILSHPHRDHFSGLVSLLDYIEKKNIIIKRFGHTLFYAGERFWKYFEVDSADKRLLSRTIKKIRILREKGLIEKPMNLTEEYPVKISNEIEMVCLAPSEDDALAFQQMVEFNADTNQKEASQAANFLSTVFVLKINSQYCLLTSDVENTTLQGIIKRNKHKFKGNQFQLCQLPHHGSIKNYYPDFWEIVETTETKHAIASAGEHRVYNHPSYEVLKAFHDSGYKIHCTNILNGMKEFTDYLTKITERSVELDPASTLAEEYRKSNDRIFLLQDETISLVE